MSRPDFKRLVAWLERDIDTTNATQSLPDDPEAAAELRRLQELVADLRADPAQPDAHRRRRIVATALQADRRAPKSRRGSAGLWLGALASGFAIVAALVLGRAVWRPEAPSFVARGTDSAADQWVGIMIFRRAGARAAPQAVADELLVTDRLLLAYSNAAPQDYGYLIVLARDQAGELFWLQPARPSADTTAAGLAIESGVTRKEIPEEIGIAALAPGTVQIGALFLSSPLPPNEAEAWLVASIAKGAPAPIPGGSGILRALQIRSP